jgi:hypothetical protein
LEKIPPLMTRVEYLDKYRQDDIFKASGISELF